jgi:hypothetical protein
MRRCAGARLTDALLHSPIRSSAVRTDYGCSSHAQRHWSVAPGDHDRWGSWRPHRPWSGSRGVGRGAAERPRRLRVPNCRCANGRPECRGLEALRGCNGYPEAARWRLEVDSEPQGRSPGAGVQSSQMSSRSAIPEEKHTGDSPEKLAEHRTGNVDALAPSDVTDAMARSATTQFLM